MAISRNQPLFQISQEVFQNLSALRFLDPLLEGEPDTIAEALLAKHMEAAFQASRNKVISLHANRKEIFEIMEDPIWYPRQMLYDQIALSIFPDLSVILSWSDGYQHILCPIPARINAGALKGSMPAAGENAGQGTHRAVSLSDLPYLEDPKVRQLIFDDAAPYLEACEDLKTLSNNPNQGKTYFSPLTAHRSLYWNNFYGRGDVLDFIPALTAELSVFLQPYPELLDEDVRAVLKSRLPDRKGNYGQIAVHLASDVRPIPEKIQAEFRKLALRYIESPVLGLRPMDQIHTAFRRDIYKFKSGQPVMESRNLRVIRPDIAETAHGYMELHRSCAEYRKKYWTENDQSQSDHSAEITGHSA